MTLIAFDGEALRTLIPLRRRDRAVRPSIQAAGELTPLQHLLNMIETNRLHSHVALGPATLGAPRGVVPKHSADTCLGAQPSVKIRRYSRPSELWRHVLVAWHTSTE